MKKTSKRIKILLCLAIFATLCGVLSVFAGYRRTLNKSGDMASFIQDGVDMAIGSIRHTATRNGVTEWRLKAASASLLNARHQALLQEPAVTFFTQDRKEVMLTARQGKVETSTNNIEVTGDVVMENDGYRLETRALNYEHNRRIFSSDTPVRITGKQFDLSADTASFDLKERQAVFKGHVKGTFGEGLSL